MGEEENRIVYFSFSRSPLFLAGLLRSRARRCFERTKIKIKQRLSTGYYGVKLRTLLIRRENILNLETNILDLETNLNVELDKVSQWLFANQLSLNIEKTSFVVLHSPQRRIAHKLNFNISNIMLNLITKLNTQDSFLILI